MVKSFPVVDEGSLLTPVGTVAEVVVVFVVADGVLLFVMFSCSIGTRCSSPEQHIREAVNFIGRLGGRDAPCLECRTRPLEVTIRLNVGLPVPVYGWAAEMVGPIPEWNVGTVVEVAEVEEFKVGARLETDVPDIDSAIWTDVIDIGTVLELEVTGFDHVVISGGGIYVVMSSS